MAKQYVVTRTISIAAPPERIQPLISDFRKWVAWSPWEDLDPDLQRSYSGAEQGEGAKYAWDGNKKAGRGNMTIVGDSPGTVEVDLEFEKPFSSRSVIDFTLRPEGDTTTVQWQMTGDYSLLTRIFTVIKSMDSMIGPDFEKGLSQLKTQAEATT
ncbi:MAG: SRPBCC family protein [Nocardioidaceae bacterium]|nr:MAG: SRPBCC family protein [Nocardioidaceae bacterium]